MIFCQPVPVPLSLAFGRISHYGSADTPPVLPRGMLLLWAHYKTPSEFSLHIQKVFPIPDTVREILLLVTGLLDFVFHVYMFP